MFFLAVLLITGCAGLGVQSDSNRTTELEAKIEALQERVDDLEMFGAGGVGANFYPARSHEGGAAGDLDTITSVVEDDVGLVATNDDGTYGDAIFWYVLDAGAGSGDKLPAYLESGDASDRWSLADVWGKGLKASDDTAGGHLRLYEDVDNGSDYMQIKADDDVGTNLKLHFSSNVANSEDWTVALGNNDDTVVFSSTTGSGDSSTFILDDGSTDSPGWAFKGGDDEQVKIWYDDSDDRICFTHSGGTVNEELCLAMDDVSNIIQFESGSGATELNFGALQMVTTGDIFGTVNQVTKTSNYTVGTDDTDEVRGTMFNNQGDTGVITFTLPAITNAGESVCFMDREGYVITIEIDGGDIIVLNGTELTAGNTIDSPGSAGDYVCLVSEDTTYWVVWGSSGTWIDGGAT
jgi:hypothetical protein